MKKKFRLLLLKLVVKIIRNYFPMTISPVFNENKKVIFYSFKWPAEIEKANEIKSYNDLLLYMKFLKSEISKTIQKQKSIEQNYSITFHKSNIGDYQQSIPNFISIIISVKIQTIKI